MSRFLVVLVAGALSFSFAEATHAKGAPASRRAAGSGKTASAAAVLAPVRPFSGADMVWAVQGEAVLGPESAPVVEGLLTGPPDLPMGCAMGDISLHPGSIEIGLRCKDGNKLVNATLLHAPRRFLVELWPGAPDAMEPLRDALAHRLNDHVADLPVQNSRLSTAPNAAPVPDPQAIWLRAATALLAHDLSAASTAVTAGVAAGPTQLSADNRLDAAILWMGQHRAAGLAASALRKQQAAWLAPLLKGGPLEPVAMAARVLAGQGDDVLAKAHTCVAPEDRPGCDILPVVRALFAVGRAADAARLVAVRVRHHNPSGEEARLAMGLAEIGRDLPLFEQMAEMLVKMTPDEPQAWLSLALALREQQKYDAAMHTLLEIPVSVALTPEMLEQTMLLADVLWDPEGGASAATRAGLVAFASPPNTAVRRLFLTLAHGFEGRLAGLDAELQAVGGAAQGTPPLALLSALRARVATAAGRLDDAHAILDGLVKLEPHEPYVQCAYFDLLLADPRTVAASVPSAFGACGAAESQAGRPGASQRLARLELLLQIYQWGLHPPAHWPFAAGL